MSQSPENASSEAADPRFQALLVAVDCSDHSNAATKQAVSLAEIWQGKLTGLHAFAAKLHDHRFKQMEGGLPEQYRKEEELEHQRDVHDDLITRGLELISDSYLDQTERACRDRGVAFERLGHEGRNYKVILDEAHGGSHDLLVLGSQGLGAVQSGVVGSVCERVARRTPIDTLVVKELDRKIGDGPILVCLDGSHQSFGGLLTALELGRRFDAPVHAIAVFDPYFHYVAFNRIADVLSDEAGEVFRFKEQEKLHEEIIDSGLAKIYQAHLRIAESIAGKEGEQVETVLKAGKPYDAILKHVAELQPGLLIMGKTGIHTNDELDIGGTTQHLLRMAPCNLWISLRTHVPDIETVAHETTSWTDEAEERMKRVPDFVRNMARMAILRYAQERGHTVVTASIVEEATAELMPGHAHKAMQEIVAAKDAGRLDKKREPERLSHPWSDEARALLDSVEDASLRGNLEGRAEKAARSEKAARVEETHVRPLLPQQESTPDISPAEGDLGWTEEAKARLERVPEGFMRDASRERIETFARREGHSEVTLDVAEGGLAEARKAMSEAMQGGHPHANRLGAAPPEGADPQKSEHDMPWDPEAAAVLERVPEGFMRNLTAQRTEARAERLGHTRITRDVVEDQFASWQQHSEAVTRTMIWEAGAYERISAAPPVVRGMVVREIEAGAQREGLEEVTTEYVEAARAKWRETGAFHVAPTQEY
ncbi:MAG: universal stress protein [Myxococcota bacterium]|jgi:nucleotide-binding universal stress UspA family protein|nr:universal stress protein [Myxococcota bacterium]